jgi:fumarylpyruvate hydrolase
MAFTFDPAPQSTLPVSGSDKLFPIHRIYCVGRNYVDHVVEMGGVPGREPPFFFSKPADAVVHDPSTLPFPPITENLHHEMELVIAIGKGGKDVSVENALDHVFGYAAGVDMTRRDLQAAAKKLGRPWSMAKGFDYSAPMSSIRSSEEIGHPESAAVRLSVNGDIRQDGDLNQQIWKVPEIVSNLSTYVELVAGDLIMTGTPAGVGQLFAGDKVEGEIAGIGSVAFVMGPNP